MPSPLSIRRARVSPALARPVWSTSAPFSSRRAASIAFALVIGSGCGGGASPPPSAGPSASAEPTPRASAMLDASAPPATDAGPPASAARDAEPSGLPVGQADADAGSFNYDLVEGIYRAHQADLKKACHPSASGAGAAFAGSVTVRVGPTGKVVASKTLGSDVAQATCIDAQIKSWTFPPPKGTATIKLPLHFRW